MEKKIYINNQLADISDELKVVVEKVVSEFRNPLKKTGARSYTIKFPQTQRNKILFNFQGERAAIGKFRTTYNCSVEVGGVTVLEGDFHLNRITSNSFEGFITGAKGGRLADILDPKKKLKEIASFTPVNFQGDRTVWDYLDMPLDATNSEIAFPYVLDSFARMAKLEGGIVDGNVMDLGFENFGVSHFTAAVFKNIFADAGYTLEGNILNNANFNRLLILYSSDGSEPAYNYGALTPTTYYPGYRYFGQAPVFQGSDYNMYVIEPEGYRSFSTLAPAISGDLAFCVGNDGVYTCKATGNYTFDIKVSSYAYDNGAGQPDMPTSQWLLFREIGESQYSDVNFPDTLASVYFDALADNSTLNELTNNTHTVSGQRHTHTSQFTAKLTAGKQYRIQVYVGIHNSVNQEKRMLVATTGQNATWFKITAMDGRQQLDPAKFLPDMLQTEFVNGIFKLFNLFYEIDQENKRVKLFTRDEWFALNRNNITDLSSKLNLDNFEETPMTDSDINETYFRWASDDNDYILSRTNYMELVNGDVSEDVYELPFSPLGFLRKKIKIRDASGWYFYEDYDLVPAAIPNTEIVDSSLLEDYTAISEFTYKPKLALYYGAGILKEQVYNVFDVNMSNQEVNGLYGIAFGRSVNPIFGQALWPGGIEYGAIPTFSYKLMPKLAFFNAKEQPAYDIEVITSTREFRLNQAPNSTFYTAGNLDFLASLQKANLMDGASIALTGSKSVFQTHYANDLLITSWSNFAEGPIKMDPVLYRNLTGKNVLRIQEDLYLLAEVKNYEVGGNTAKIKVYKLISG